LGGLLQPQCWQVGLGPSGEIQVLYPLDICHPSKEIDEWDFPDPLDLDYDEEEDLALALLDAIEEDFHKEVKVARAKHKGTRELLNLKTSINYGNNLTSNRQGKGKAQGRHR
jgi:hypothetical protein